MAEHAAENDAARQYLDAIAENGSFGDVVDFAYELLGRLERVIPPGADQ